MNLVLKVFIAVSLQVQSFHALQLHGVTSVMVKEGAANVRFELQRANGSKSHTSFVQPRLPSRARGRNVGVICAHTLRAFCMIFLALWMLLAALAIVLQTLDRFRDVLHATELPSEKHSTSFLQPHAGRQFGGNKKFRSHGRKQGGGKHIPNPHRIANSMRRGGFDHTRTRSDVGNAAVILSIVFFVFWIILR